MKLPELMPGLTAGAACLALVAASFAAADGEKPTGSQGAGAAVTWDAEGFTVLHRAVMKANVTEAKAILAGGMNVDVKTVKERETSLHIASRWGLGELAKVLIAKGADLNARNHQRETPLFLAAEGGNTEVVKMLLDAGAKPDLFRTWDRLTPLHAAASQDRAELVKALLEKGADPNARTRGNKLTPLHIAAEKDREEVVDELLKHKADANALDRSGRTPLDVAVGARSEEAEKALRRAGAKEGPKKKEDGAEE